MSGLGALFCRYEDDWLSGNATMMKAVERWDHGMTRELYRQVATNIYKTKDGRWFSLHGNMDPTPLLNMLQAPQHNERNLSWPEILDMYAGIVAKHDSEALDNWSNNVYRTPGTICYEADEFLALPHVGVPLPCTPSLPVLGAMGNTVRIANTLCSPNRARQSRTSITTTSSNKRTTSSPQWPGDRDQILPIEGPYLASRF